MNERIRELILEAGFPKFDKMYVVSDGEELEKFAELVVRKVFTKIENERFEIYQPVKESVMKHFGIEE